MMTAKGHEHYEHQCNSSMTASPVQHIPTQHVDYRSFHDCTTCCCCTAVAAAGTAVAAAGVDAANAVANVADAAALNNVAAANAD